MHFILGLGRGSCGWRRRSSTRDTRQVGFAATFVLLASAGGLLTASAPCMAQPFIAAKTSGAAGPPVYGAAELLGNLSSPVINESSGLAISRVRPDRLWTHNDSGTGPKLFAVDLTGQLVATCSVEGARAIDWEDMASFLLDNQPFLVIGDFGDNRMTRGHYQLYLVPEPALPAADLHVAREVEFRFESDSFDCESVAFDPTTREFILVAKTWKPFCTVFALPLPADDDKSVQIARRIASLPLAGITGMDISPDGARAILVSYTSAYEYERLPDQTWGQAFARPPIKRTMPERIQGEAICYGQDGKTLFLTSEQRPCPLFRVPPATDDGDDPTGRPEAMAP